MFTLVFLGLMVVQYSAAISAAWYDPYDYNNEFQHEMANFWNNFNRDMRNLNREVQNVVKQSKNREYSQIDGNEFKLTIYLAGFNKEDIVVKAKKGNLVIQANHNVPGEPVNNYLDVRDLPDFVNENGSWSYNNGILTIFFPILERGNYGKL